MTKTRKAINMESTSFLSSTIQRIARKRRTSTLLWLGGILIIILCFLGMLLLLQLPDAGFFYILLIVAALVVCGLIFMSVAPLSRAILNPLESFYVNDLRRYGPLQQTMAQIDEEACAYVGKIGSFVTPHWVISALSNSLNFMRLEDVVWIYKRLSESNVTFYHAITVSSGKSYAAQIWNRHGYLLTISSTEAGVDALLAQIMRAAPWVTQRYLELLNEAWNRRRADFIADVDRKRQQILFVTSGGSAAASASASVASSGDFKPQSQAVPSSLQPSPLSGFNRAVDQELIEAYQTRQDRKIRASGCLVLVLGIGLSAIFILPLVLGVLGNAKELSYSNEGVWVSLFLLLAGVYYIAFGQKGKTFYERTLFRNWWTIALLVVLGCIGLIFFDSALESLLRFFGYGSANP